MAQIVELEEAIGKYRLGVRAEVVLNRHEVKTDGPPMTLVESLEYGKNKGRWGLWFVEYYEDSVDADDPESYHAIPLKDAPREIRFQAVDKIQDLLQELAEKGREFAAEAARKSERVAQVVSMLKRTQFT